MWSSQNSPAVSSLPRWRGVLALTMASAFLVACPEPPSAGDAGLGTDGGDRLDDEDAGGDPVDAGEPDPTPAVDAGDDDGGTPPDDGGRDDDDAGTDDAGAPREDAGELPLDDAGNVEPDVDAGNMPVDAGPIEPDPEVPSTVEEACSTATELSDGVVYNGNTDPFGNLFDQDCTTNDSREQVFVYVPTSPLSLVVASLDSTDGDDLALSMRTDCADVETELACSDSSGASGTEVTGLTYVPAGMPVFIIVDGFRSDDHGPFTLLVEETAIPLLQDGEACDPNAVDEEAICDPFVDDLACLHLGDGEHQCGFQEVLQQGEVCVTTSDAAVCDDAAGLSCVDVGDGSTLCDVPLDAKCTYAGALTTGVSASRTPTRNDVSGNCGNATSAEAAFTYTVQAPSANVHIDVTGGSTVHVRTVCDDDATEVACASANDGLFLFNQKAGDSFVIFVESATDVTVTVTEDELTLLPLSAACDPSDDLVICNPDRDLECLIVNGSDICTTQTVLAEGDACVMGDTGHICDNGAGLYCLENEVGGVTCEDPARLQCLVRSEILPSQLATATTVTNVSQGSCAGANTAEAVFTYTVQNPIANLRVFGPPGPSALYARVDCADTDSELGCSTNTTDFKVRNVRQGEDITLFAEAPADTDITLAIIEEIVTILDEGDACDPASDTALCDTRDGVDCYDVEGENICFRPVILAEGAACEPASLTHLCDTDDGVYCLDVNNEDVCFRPVVLAEGDACTPGSLTEICDIADGVGCYEIDGSDICFRPTIVGEGETCDGTALVCEGGLECVEVDGLPGGCVDQINPPSNDTCQTATLLTGSGGTVVGWLENATPDYNAEALGDCTNWHSNGTDVVYAVNLSVGDRLDVEVASDRDGSIMLFDTCPPPSGTGCIVGSDSGEPEDFSYTATSAGTYYIVVDSYTAVGEGFHMTWSVQ